MSKPLLSIGIIFKNEIRCLERCLKSLQPLRDAIPCELVMADTGATDGSREVAEKYADSLFDFSWINDFSAARNAVIDRCSGEWYMSIDCDEWVDKNIEGYVAFLTTNEAFDFASVIIRNYNTIDWENGGTYSDFMAVRFLRLSTGIRYEGSIHEHWPYKGDLRTMLIRDAVFHHDGYVYQDATKQKEKQERNMELLKEQLKKDPDNLIVLTQCIESGDGLPEQGDYLRQAMEGVKQKWSQWELFGPPIYRCAVRFAIAHDLLDELAAWIQDAEAMFPNSIFVRVEIAYFAFGTAWNKDDYPEAIRWGERYIQGVADYEAGRFNRADILASSLNKTDSHSWLSVATALASGYLYEKQPEKCLRLMETVDGREMDAKQAGDCVRNLCNLHGHFDLDTAPLLLRLWDEINEPVPNKEQAAQRRATFLAVGEGMFEGAFIDSEADAEDFVNHAYGVFLPLEGRCVLGDAARMLDTKDPSQLEAILSRVEDLERLPATAFIHALRSGVRFPIPSHPLPIERMDALAAGVAKEQWELITLVKKIADDGVPDSAQELAWARGLCIVALKGCAWKAIDAETGLLLARTFARVEGLYLPLCYASDTLREENLDILPPMHRFGWYLIRAFEALDMGDAASYVRLLRSGLETNEGTKSMVEFLTKHTPELQAPPPSHELLALAEQVRSVLARFAPDDPAVAALKQSEAYQKVAYLIAGTESSVAGGWLQ